MEEGERTETGNWKIENRKLKLENGNLAGPTGRSYIAFITRLVSIFQFPISGYPGAQGIRESVERKRGCFAPEGEFLGSNNIGFGEALGQTHARG